MGQHDRWGAFVDRLAHSAKAATAGDLAGVRVAVKDNIATAGLRWTAGLPLLAGRIAPADASCVALLRDAGAEITGTTATDSAGFGMMTPGVVNPLAAERTAGGSSGGSAAAVAAGLADLALGTDTGGSVRVPAACCGLLGLKPTFGRVPIEGVTPLSFSFDHVGLIARDLDVLERGWRVLAGIRPAAPIRNERLRMGFDPERLADCSSVERGAVEKALVWLEAQGHALSEIRLPKVLEVAEVHGAIVCAEAADIWSAHWPHDRKLFTETARRSLDYAARITAREIADARHRLADIRARIAHSFDAVDVVLGPTIAVPPPPAGARRVSYAGGDVPVVLALLAETCTFNVSGNPALAMPLPWPGEAGIPVSLQIAARHGREDTAMGLARTLGQPGPDA